MHVGTVKARLAALRCFRKIVSGLGHDEPELGNDLIHANKLIARAVGKSSWTTNQSWILKFTNYIKSTCPELLRRRGLRNAVLCPRVALAFLAAVNQENPSAKTRVDAAKRAINLARTMANLPSLNDTADVALLAKAARNPSVSTPRQSPGIPAIYVAAIVRKWGASSSWWRRQVATMIVLAYCVLARGAGIVSCEANGLAWVRHDGSLHRDQGFVPTRGVPLGAACNNKWGARGVLLLLPWRKNKQHQPSWLPISDAGALSLLATFMR